jgi:hypothetical protein
MVAPAEEENMTVIAFTTLPGVSYEIDESNLVSGWLDKLDGQLYLPGKVMGLDAEGERVVVGRARVRVEHIVAFEFPA